MRHPLTRNGMQHRGRKFNMRWIFKTHHLHSTFRFTLLGFPVWYGPILYAFDADNIVDADKIFQRDTGIDPCKPQKSSGIFVSRYCPQLACNQTQDGYDASGAQV
jgi:hypothetical protein